MSEPTQGVPPVGGPPPVDPPTGAPPGPPGQPGPDRRIIIISVLVGALVLMVIALIVVRADGDGDVVATESTTTTTTTTSTTTTRVAESTSPSEPVTTPTTAPTTTTTRPSTTTTTASTTTTTAPPPVTIAPNRCRGTTGPNDPDTVAVVFYDAWRVDDRNCAAEIASDGAIATLFQVDGSDARWVEQGCGPHDDAPEPHTDCVFSYEGGAAFFEMRFGAIDGWQVFNVRFVAD